MSRRADTERRFPIEPLLRSRSIADLGRTTSIDPSQFHRYRRKGGIPASRADVVAIALGCHPLELWPDWLDDLTEKASVA